MSNTTNSKQRAMVTAIAVGILVMTLGTPAFAASRPAQFAGNSALRSASSAPPWSHAGGNGNGQGDNNNQGNPSKYQLELPRNWFYPSLGTVGDVLKGVVVAAQTMGMPNVAFVAITADDPSPF